MMVSRVRTELSRAFALLGVSIFCATQVHAQNQTPAPKVPVSIRAAVVTPDLAVKALPQQTFQFIGGRNDTVTVVTALDGSASVSLRPGAYLLRSAAPIVFGGQSYEWTLPIMVERGMKGIELTQSNAHVTQAVAMRPSSSSRRRVSEEAEIFEKVRGGVFTIYGQEGKGSGFLVDPAGLVLTNAHVVEGTDDARVQLDSATALKGSIVFVDKARDVAVLAIAQSRISGRPVLPLAEATDGPLVSAGERVLAVGSPLNQTGVLTIGIVSKLEPRAIISDVNINHGNSGGPLINLDGQVVAINTFGDISEQGGPGISGSILITEAKDALAAARAKLSSMESVSAELMPVAPRIAFPIEGLNAAASQEAFDLRPYSGSAGPFDLQFLTPPVGAWRQAAAIRELVKRRKEREARANVTEGERIDVIQGWKSWDEYVGQRQSVVVVQIMPRVGETTASKWGNFLGALAAGMSHQYYQGHQLLEFKGDFRSMKLFRDGVEVQPIQLNRIPAVLNVSDYLKEGKDVAYQGIYVYRPEDFEPHQDGSPAEYTIEITDTAHLREPVRASINPKTLTAVWRDFAPYRIATGAR